MAKEAVLQIKDAEEQAANVLREATERARAVSDSSVSGAEDMALDIMSKARAKREQILKDAEHEANKQSIPLMEACDEDTRKILNPDKGKFELAVKAVTERIVNIHGNSKDEPISALSI